MPGKVITKLGPAIGKQGPIIGGPKCPVCTVLCPDCTPVRVSSSRKNCPGRWLGGADFADFGFCLCMPRKRTATVSGVSFINRDLPTVDGDSLTVSVTGFNGDYCMNVLRGAAYLYSFGTGIKCVTGTVTHTNPNSASGSYSGAAFLSIGIFADLSTLPGGANPSGDLWIDIRGSASLYCNLAQISGSGSPPYTGSTGGDLYRTGTTADPYPIIVPHAFKFRDIADLRTAPLESFIGYRDGFCSSIDWSFTLPTNTSDTSTTGAYVGGSGGTITIGGGTDCGEPCTEGGPDDPCPDPCDEPECDGKPKAHCYDLYTARNNGEKCIPDWSTWTFVRTIKSIGPPEMPAGATLGQPIITSNGGDAFIYVDRGEVPDSGTCPAPSESDYPTQLTGEAKASDCTGGGDCNQGCDVYTFVRDTETNTTTLDDLEEGVTCDAISGCNPVDAPENVCDTGWQGSGRFRNRIIEVCHGAGAPATPSYP